MGYIPNTTNGYQFGEVASALQKCIRRGDDRNSLKWAIELHRSGYGEYVWKRLRIIASEDIGLAAPPGWQADLRALYENWTDQKKKKDTKHEPERLFLVHGVLMCSRAPKSRLIDWALMAEYEEPRDVPPIPDVAKDQHTLAGKRMGRGYRHFVDEGAKVEPHHPQPLEDEYRDMWVQQQENGGTPNGHVREQPEPDVLAGRTKTDDQPKLV